MGDVALSDLNLLAIVVAGLASFAASGVWYAALGSRLAKFQQQWRGASVGGPTAAALPIFIGSQIVLAAGVALVFAAADVSGLGQTLVLAVVLWVGFCVTQWVSSIAGEQVPVGLAAIHGGDWLLHLLVIGTIVGLWR